MTTAPRRRASRRDPQTTSEGGGHEETGAPTTGAASAPSPDTTTGTGTDTTDAQATGDTSSGPGTATTGEGDTCHCGFICDGECGQDSEGDGACDVFKQDCPEGQKCTAWGVGGGSWDATRCAEVTGDDAPGDTCTTEGGGVTGNDRCIKGAMCWGADAETNEGVYVGLCTGTADAPMCAEAVTLCAIANGGVLNLCLPGCDPLASDCADDDVCISVIGGFACVLDASGEEGQQYDPCEYANGCDQGLFCGDPVNAGMCDPNATGCCLPFCDITEDPTPCTDGLKCATWWAEGQSIPPGLENIGACIIGA